MIIVFKKKATSDDIRKVAEDFGGLYIKVVVDVSRKILAAGGERHFDAEQILLKDGSKQADLWGGGLDAKTGETDYNSMINIRPNRDNPSRDILSADVRQEFDKIVKNLMI